VLRRLGLLGRGDLELLFGGGDLEGLRLFGGGELEVPFLSAGGVIDRAVYLTSFVCDILTNETVNRSAGRRMGEPTNGGLTERSSIN